MGWNKKDFVKQESTSLQIAFHSPTWKALEGPRAALKEGWQARSPEYRTTDIGTL